MPARLYFSNSLEALADRLIENLDHEGADPFRAPALATPASSLRDWLKIHLAERWGIAANIAFPHLENLLWERLAERDRLRDVPDRQPARLLDTFSFQGLVLAQLRRGPPAELREYLRAGDATDAARRLCQISGRLASLFREYEYSRVSESGYQGLADSWSRGMACFEPALLRGNRLHPAAAHLQEVRGLEAWQMEVYRKIFQEEEGLRDQWGRASGVYRYTLPQYAEKALADPVAPADNTAVFHLFGLSNISPFHRNLIGRLADDENLGDGAARFEIYALNPCAEYWEDALTPREKRSHAPRPIARARIEAARPDETEIRNAEIAEAPGENGLLTLLGKPGRETIKLWCQLTEYDFHEDFREPARATLLAAVQTSVLSRSPALPPEARVSQDGSLRIRSAPEARSEIELVRAEAAELLRKDPSLRPEEMAVIAADPDAVLPLLRAVFAGGKDAPGNVPVLLPGASAESPVLRGFRDLLGPRIASADRNALLALLENPAVLRKTRLESARAASLRNFLEAAGFQEGWESATPEDEAGGGSTARDAETRAVMALALDPGDPALESAGWWPARGTAGVLERTDLAALLEWLDALREALRPFRENADLSFAEWSLRARALQDGFLAADPNDPADVRAEIDLRRFCAELGQWGEWNEAPERSGEGDRVGGALIRMLFEDRFREPDAARAGFLRGGVRVGSLSALRGIPFRHVWVTGLAADTFPASGDAAPLDLRAYRRLPGESDPSARDLYALLEVIASATESVTLSWPRRDPARDAERPSSRALNGLAAWLESDILPTGTALNISADGAPARPEPAPFDPRTRSVRWSPEPRREAPFVEWKGLARYLRNPADHAVTEHFQLRAYDALDPEEEARAAALFVDRWKDAEFLDEALRAELGEPGTGEAAFNRLWWFLLQGGRLPPPPFRDIEEARVRAVVTGRLAENAALLRGYLDAAGLRFAGALRCGPQGAATAKPPVLNLPAFDLSPLGIPASLGGILPWFFQGDAQTGGWGVLVEKDGEFPAYLLQLCLAALPGQGAYSRISGGPAHLFTRDKDQQIRMHALPVLEAEEARTILRALLEDFLGGPDFDDLRFEAIEKSARMAAKNARPVRDWRDEIESQRREEEENPYARPSFSVRLLRALRTGVPEDAARKIARRLEPYLAWKAAYAGSGEEEAS